MELFLQPQAKTSRIMQMCEGRDRTHKEWGCSRCKHMQHEVAQEAHEGVWPSLLAHIRKGIEVVREEAAGWNAGAHPAEALLLLGVDSQDIPPLPGCVKLQKKFPAQTTFTGSIAAVNAAGKKQNQTKTSCPPLITHFSMQHCTSRVDKTSSSTVPLIVMQHSFDVTKRRPLVLH